MGLEMSRGVLVVQRQYGFDVGSFGFLFILVFLEIPFIYTPVYRCRLLYFSSLLLIRVTPFLSFVVVCFCLGLLFLPEYFLVFFPFSFVSCVFIRCFPCGFCSGRAVSVSAVACDHGACFSLLIRVKHHCYYIFQMDWMAA